MNTKLAELKEAIKNQADEIRQTKKKRVETQKAGKYAGDWQSLLVSERSLARSQLIAYGLLRGREYNTIERPREGNEPNWKTIDKLREEYAHEEDVCVSA